MSELPCGIPMCHQVGSSSAVGISFPSELESMRLLWSRGRVLRGAGHLTSDPTVITSELGSAFPVGKIVDPDQAARNFRVCERTSYHTPTRPTTNHTTNHRGYGTILVQLCTRYAGRSLRVIDNLAMVNRSPQRRNHPAVRVTLISWPTRFRGF